MVILCLLLTEQNSRHCKPAADITILDRSYCTHRHTAASDANHNYTHQIQACRVDIVLTTLPAPEHRKSSGAVHGAVLYLVHLQAQQHTQTHHEKYFNELPVWGVGTPTRTSCVTLFPQVPVLSPAFRVIGCSVTRSFCYAAIIQ